MCHTWPYGSEGLPVASRVAVVRGDQSSPQTCLTAAWGAIDAVLAAVAAREAAQGAQATVFTSDTDDLHQLLADHSVPVEKV